MKACCFIALAGDDMLAKMAEAVTNLGHFLQDADSMCKVHVCFLLCQLKDSNRLPLGRCVVIDGKHKVRVAAMHRTNMQQDK